MKITEDVRKFAAQQQISEEDALQLGLEQKAKEFVEKGQRFTKIHSRMLFRDHLVRVIGLGAALTLIPTECSFARSAWENIKRTAHKTVADGGAEFDRGRRRTGKELTRARENTGAAITKARKDSVNEVIRAPKNLDKARLAIQRFAYREVNGLGDGLSDAERRIRQGKFADAIWHLATDPAKHTEENAARMVQESSIIRAIGQVVATAYGGFGGAAAYASWYTYRETKDPELAIRVGLITGATSAAMNQLGKIPSYKIDPVTHQWEVLPDVITRKVAVAGAIGGLAVAASGGDERALRDGFLYSGGTILVQDIYENVTHHTLNAKASEKEAYAMLAEPDAPGAPPREAYYDENGIPNLDKNGRIFPDVRRTDSNVSHLGRWADPADFSIFDERSPIMYALSKVPAMNAMSLFHDQCAVYLDMNMLTSVGTIPPAIVFTYIGTGTQTYDLIQKTASAKGKQLRERRHSRTAGDDKLENTRSGGVPTKESEIDQAYIEEAGAFIRGLDLDGNSQQKPRPGRNAAGQWTPGLNHPNYRHVTSADAEDSWQPDPGYEWIYPDDSDDLSVRWKPGLRHPEDTHVFSSTTEGKWIVANGSEATDPVKE
jgi:hypothetical protein